MTEWDDGSTHKAIQKISISHSERPEDGAIGYFQVTYDDGEGLPHGTTPPGFKSATIPLESEHITHVSGYKGKSSLDRETIVVRSLTFVTDKHQHGPYGVETGEQFNYPIASYRLVGFKGASNILVHDIGVYLTAP